MNNTSYPCILGAIYRGYKLWLELVGNHLVSSPSGENETCRKNTCWYIRSSTSPPNKWAIFRWNFKLPWKHGKQCFEVLSQICLLNDQAFVQSQPKKTPTSLEHTLETCNYLFTKEIRKSWIMFAFGATWGLFQGWTLEFSYCLSFIPHPKFPPSYNH